MVERVDNFNPEQALFLPEEQISSPVIADMPDSPSEPVSIPVDRSTTFRAGALWGSPIDERLAQATPEIAPEVLPSAQEIIDDIGPWDPEKITMVLKTSRKSRFGIIGESGTYYALSLGTKDSELGLTFYTKSREEVNFSNPKYTPLSDFLTKEYTVQRFDTMLSEGYRICQRFLGDNAGKNYILAYEEKDGRVTKVQKIFPTDSTLMSVTWEQSDNQLVSLECFLNSPSIFVVFSTKPGSSVHTQYIKPFEDELRPYLEREQAARDAAKASTPPPAPKPSPTPEMTPVVSSDEEEFILPTPKPSPTPKPTPAPVSALEIPLELESQNPTLTFLGEKTVLGGVGPNDLSEISMFWFHSIARHTRLKEILGEKHYFWLLNNSSKNKDYVPYTEVAKFAEADGYKQGWLYNTFYGLAESDKQEIRDLLDNIQTQTYYANFKYTKDGTDYQIALYLDPISDFCELQISSEEKRFKLYGFDDDQDGIWEFKTPSEEFSPPTKEILENIKTWWKNEKSIATDTGEDFAITQKQFAVFEKGLLAKFQDDPTEEMAP